MRQPTHRGRGSDAPPVKTIGPYVPYEPKSSTSIPNDIVQEIWDYYDGHLQWCVFEAAGKPTPEWISARQKMALLIVGAAISTASLITSAVPMAAWLSAG
jgi:hypothetical protein